MQIAIPLFPRVTALDAVGPYEILQRLPGATVVFVGAAVGEVRTENGFLGLSVDATFGDVPSPDVVVVPGGIGTRALLALGSPLVAWVRGVHPRTRYTASVCTGSLVLAAAGVLDGVPAATHWGARGELAALGAAVAPAGERVTEDLGRRVLTAAGVSAGMDMALRLAELLVDEVAAQAMQLAVEYDPQPKFDAGSAAKASPAVHARLCMYSETKR